MVRRTLPAADEQGLYLAGTSAGRFSPLGSRGICTFPTVSVAHPRFTYRSVICRLNEDRVGHNRWLICIR